MGPTARPETYQDVKTNLRWYTSGVMLLVAIFVYAFLLPAEHREVLSTFFELLPSSSILGAGLLIVLLELVGWVLIFLLEIHDKFYDRHIIQWRRSYDLDFILPTLYMPFADKLDPRFFRQAQTEPYTFTKPFYHFVGDKSVKISPNLVVRFYERVTKYWITQINEILLILLLALVFAYFFVYRAEGLIVIPLFLWTYAIFACLVLNRLAARIAKQGVRRATQEEIEEVHADHLNELDEQLRELHSRTGLQYGPQNPV